MFKKFFINLIGRENYVKYVTFVTDLSHANLPLKVRGKEFIADYCIKRGGTVLDVGANVGRFTSFAAQRVGRSGKVFSFEPVPYASRVLKFMVNLRKFKQVTVIESGLSDKLDSAVINVPLKDGWKPAVPTAHIAKSTDVIGGRQLTINLETIDHFCEKNDISKIDFIKCDVEGYEYFVFKGAEKTLTNIKPTVFAEVDASYFKRNNLTTSDLFSYFKNIGYQAFIPTNTKGKIRAVDQYEYPSDYFFIHPDKLDDSIKKAITQ